MALNFRTSLKDSFNFVAPIFYFLVGFQNLHYYIPLISLSKVYKVNHQFASSLNDESAKSSALPVQ